MAGKSRQTALLAVLGLILAYYAGEWLFQKLLQGPRQTRFETRRAVCASGSRAAKPNWPKPSRRPNNWRCGTRSHPLEPRDRRLPVPLVAHRVGGVRSFHQCQCRRRAIR